MRLSWSTLGVAFALTTSPAHATTCPLPLCSKCLTREDSHALGIGFDLSTAYGTAVVRYPNGSVVNVAKIDASRAYQSMMKQLSEKRRGALHSRFGPITDEPVHIGKPAQRPLQAADLDIDALDLDIDTLSFLIAGLKAQTEKLLGHSIRLVAISSPDYIQLSETEINQAITDLGLKNLADHHTLTLTSSEYAGYSSGLLTIPTALDLCEEKQSPTETILHLEYTQTTLSGSISYLQGSTLHHTDSVFADWHLGLSKKPQFIEEEAYWDQLWRRLRGQIQDLDRRITKVILTGDAVLPPNDPRFFVVAHDALRGFVESSALHAFGHTPDPVFAAARGAAEFAKGIQGSNRHCIESEKCRSL
ncbi:hypothetical protein AJ78_08635 [Emergomyces pasteurianus Ep9510]|uniref:Uncharacterized protein n=1 Tax=Emergomyces pasteurianus Ep9510 TaxID=1447872 RepID=A0A1J9Q577_9EURO|nr:hypothetical protein AJ78_08635 [Emergomyces pasteurianus Ep9510]